MNSTTEVNCSTDMNIGFTFCQFSTYDMTDHVLRGQSLRLNVLWHWICILDIVSRTKLSYMYVFIIVIYFFYLIAATIWTSFIQSNWESSSSWSRKLILKVSFIQKVLLYLSFPQTDEPNYFPELEFWIRDILKESNHVK